MPRAIIVGSGPAAAGAALALTGDPSYEVVVLDLGNTLDEGLASRRARLAHLAPSEWSKDDVAQIGQRAPVVKGQALPEKRSFGSAYPFENVSQLDGIEAESRANSHVVSGAYGGFSNVWGSQIMPFSEATFDDWPCSFNDMEPHYRRALDEMPLAAETDELATTFPLIQRSEGLPPPAERTAAVLRRARLRRSHLHKHGVTVGNARLALRGSACVRCGLCMTGCPYELIYSASHTFDRLRQQRRIQYHGGLRVTRVAQHGHVCQVRALDIRTDRAVSFDCDKLFLACGGIGTTRLVLGSMASAPPKVELLESVQFGLPFVSRHPTSDPRTQANYTLNQFNVVVDVSGFGKDLVQIHCYPYNPALSDSLPALVRARWMEPAHRGILRRLTVGLGYLPSWASPKIILTQEPNGEDLPKVCVSGEAPEGLPMLSQALKTLRRVGPAIDLWPVSLGSFVSGPAKSYHFGGSFPHRPGGGVLQTDRLGRLAQWTRIHLADASVFPSVPATTFTLTVMANAHRIAKESLLE